MLSQNTPTSYLQITVELYCRLDGLEMSNINTTTFDLKVN